jgi:hypothetical protein
MGDAPKLDLSPQADLFHHGVITRLFPSNNIGFVRVESGREIPFSYEFVIVCGAAKTVHDLREEQPVGYDLGWTPRGLRVTKIKSEGHATLTGEPSSERQSGQT